MTTAYTSLLGLALPVTGELSGTWGDTVNNSITSLLDSAIAGTTTLSADTTLTTTTGASNQARQAILLCTGQSANITITAPAQSKIYTVINASATYTVKIRGAGPTTGITIPVSSTATVAWNGSDFVDASGYINGNLKVNGTLTVTGTATIGGNTAVTGTLSATGNATLSGATAEIQFTGATYGWLRATVGDLYIDAPSTKSIFLRNAGTTIGAVSSTGLAVTGTLTLSSATSGTIASFKSTGAYGTVAADNTGTTGGGSFSVRQNGTQYGAFSVEGAIQGNTSSDLAIFADTGSALKFFTNGSATVKASLSTAGLFTVAGAASIQGLTVGLGNASASATSTAVGISALASSTGADATAFGYFAGENLSSGAFSIAIGSRAMGGTTGGPNTGSYNTAIGNSALAQNTSGNRNIAIGNEALSANQTGVSNVAVGSYQPAGGDAVLGVNTAGNYNTAVGSAALAKNTASSNTAVGYTASFTNTSGTSNVAVGASALYQNSTSSNNTAIGASALANATGSSNTGVGQGVMYGTSSASYNTGVGDSALGNVTGSNNTAVGYQALTASGLSGTSNTAVGYQAGSKITSGTENILIGANAGSWTTGITTGGYNTHIASFSNPSATSATYEIVLSATDIGVTGKGSSTGFINPKGGGVYQGNNSTTWSTTSDQRLKKNIVDNNIGLEKIAAIQVRNFEYRVAEEITELPAHTAIEKSGVQLGVIAQELQQVLPECVKTESTGVMSVDTDNLIWYAINAIKELKAEVDSLKSQLNGA